MVRLAAVTDNRAATRAHYDRWPYDFDTPLHAPMQLDGSLLGRALRETAPGAAVVDVGCGTGLVSRLARAQLPGATVVGIDLSLGSLRRVRASDPGIAVAEGDNLALPVRSAAAALVVSRGVIMTTPDPRRAFAELVRITRSGGRLFVRVYNRDNVYRPVYRILGGLCRAIARVPGGKALLAVTVYPLFLVALEIGCLLVAGRMTRFPRGAGWNLFADQLLTPHNSFHTIDEVRGWGEAERCRCLAHRSLTLGQQIELLFVKDA
jgi:SAM-dependent methyltransferase